MKATYVEKQEANVRWNDNKTHAHHDNTFKITGFEIFKDPVTDSGMKKSARGLLRVIKDEDTFKLEDQITWDEVNSPDNQLKVIFKDGEFTNKVTFEEIRERVKKLV